MVQPEAPWSAFPTSNCSPIISVPRLRRGRLENAVIAVALSVAVKGELVRSYCSVLAYVLRVGDLRAAGLVVEREMVISPPKLSLSTPAVAGPRYSPSTPAAHKIYTEHHTHTHLASSPNVV